MEKSGAGELLEQVSLRSLAKGFKSYFHAIRLLLRPWLSCPELLADDSPEKFEEAKRFFFYSVCISFFILMPVWVVHREPVPKFWYLVRSIVCFILIGFAMHAAFYLLGARQISWRRTLMVYCYIVGIMTPLYLILFLPLLVITGPIGLFGGINDLSVIQSRLEPSCGMLVYLFIAQIVLTVIGTTILLRWVSVTHRLRKWRILVALVLVGAFMAIFQLWMLNPALNIVAEKTKVFVDALF